MPDVHSLVNEFVIKLKKRKIEGSKATAKLTAELLRSFISQQRLPHTNEAGALIDAVKAVGEKLIAANLVELAVGNVVRRVLHIIREEDLSLTTAAVGGLSLAHGSDDEDDVGQDDHPILPATAVAAASRNALRPPSLQTLLEDIPHSAAAPHTSSSGGDSEGKNKSADRNSATRKLKHNVIEAVNDLILEISTCHDQIAEQAVEHIHHNEVILTLGSSRTVVEFLCAAKEKKRSFRVFVAEGAPRYQGHALAKELAARGLQTTVITDSAVFAMISRVNMVVVGAHAVMANGGVIAPVGLNMVALAAQRHAVPFVVLAGVHKSCLYIPPSLRVKPALAKTPAVGASFEQKSIGRYQGRLSNPKPLNSFSFAKPQTSLISSGVQRKLDLNNQDVNKNDKNQKNEVKQQPKYRPPGLNGINKSPANVEKTRRVSDAAEKLGNMTLCSGKSVVAKRSSMPPPMKAGGWHQQSDLLVGRSQEILPGRSYIRKVAG